TLGFLHTMQFGARNDTVISLQHNFSPTASAALFFNQMSAANDNNTVGQISADSRWGKFSAGGAWEFSSGHKAGGEARSFTLGYSDKHLFHGLEYLDYAPQFRAADGLVPFTDIKGFDMYEEYLAEWRKGFWQSLAAAVGGQYQWHQDGRPFQRSADL